MAKSIGKIVLLMIDDAGADAIVGDIVLFIVMLNLSAWQRPW